MREGNRERGERDWNADQVITIRYFFNVVLSIPDEYPAEPPSLKLKGSNFPFVFHQQCKGGGN